MTGLLKLTGLIILKLVDNIDRVTNIDRVDIIDRVDQIWKKFVPFWAPELGDKNPSADFLLNGILIFLQLKPYDNPFWGFEQRE